MMDQLWQFFYDYRVEFIVAFVVALIILIIMTPLHNLFRKLWELIFPPADKKKEQDRKLRTHFEYLKSKIIQPMAACAEHSFCYRGYNGEHFARGLSLSLPFDESSEDYRAFKAHFRDIATKWESLINEANECVERHNDFIGEVKEALKKKISPIPVMEYEPNSPVPYVDSSALQPLFDIWLAPAKGYKSYYNFNNAYIRKDRYEKGEEFILRVNLYVCAVTNKYEEAERCKNIFISMQESQGYKEKAVMLSRCEERVREKFLKLKDRVGQRAERIIKPGIDIKKEFKKQDDCPICQKF